MKRLMMFVSLLLAFVMGTWAEDNTKGTDNSNTVSQIIPDTGIDKDNGVVYLNDLEDHTWTYYSGVPESVDGGNYNRSYLGKIYSPNPRNVMITYDGNGGAVSINEPETKFVYYKTLECKEQTVNEVSTNTYPYTVISNPFSKRPTGKGFGGWKIVSGGEFIKGYDDGNTLPLDAEIVFEKLPYGTEGYPVNCISAEIEFQATWVPAQVTYLSNVKTDNTDYAFEVKNIITENVPTTYENNFLVINKGYSGNLTISQPCTIMMVEPDGSVDYRDKAFTKLITPMQDGNTKIEYAHWKPTASIDAMGRNFTIGRGMVMDGTARALYGTNTDKVKVDQILKVESGKFTSLIHYNVQGTSEIIVDKNIVILGCDYDRARGDDNNLLFTSRFRVGTAIKLALTTKQYVCRTYSLSGRFMTNISVNNASLNDCYYLSINSGTNYSAENLGHRYFEIQGGEWVNIAGGTGINTSGDGIYDPTFTFRMKGGLLKGSIYGGAEYGSDGGARTYIITGGNMKGWLAGGANGTSKSGGQLYGASYIYVGGNARIDSEGSENLINRAVGGNVFGAGCGYNVDSSSGQVTLGTNVVIADNAYVERGVYGGGSYGFCNKDQTSNIYITGGTVGGNVGGVIIDGDGVAKYSGDIHGGVYGGACQNKGGNVNIYMTDGTVNGGLYGGSNASGTLSGNVNIKITGGTIGGEMNGIQTYANVYGGGYGSGTIVNGSVNVTLDNIDASIETMINGDVYGGGAEGKVNKSISVNVNDAAINGDLYGGGHGTNAKVTGSSTVNVSGGTINNVFGGGNAAELAGNSTVAITGGTVTGNVYGGGNQAKVEGQTKVVIGSSGQ